MRQLARAPSPRRSGTPAAAPTRAFTPEVAAPAAHDLSRVAVSAPVPRAPAGQAPIQRVVTVGGKPLTKEEEAEAHKNNNDRKSILANWHKSDLEHDFTDMAYLHRALGRAQAQPEDAPDLFNAENLSFLTQSKNRLPTLYFKQGGDSGRLRQQHHHGPLIQTETHKSDYFFPSKQHRNAFKQAAMKAHDEKTDFDPSTLKDVEFSTKPYKDAHHLEVSWNPEQGKEKQIYNLHPSEGTVATDLQGYDNNAIKAMYKKITGRSS